MFTQCCQASKSEEDKNRRYSVRQLLEMQDELNSLVQSGWKGTLSENNFLVALIDEYGGELLGSGINWKHWKNVDPSKYDEFNAKIETIDAAFFWLSVLILRLQNVVDLRMVLCGGDDLYRQFDHLYVGTDKGFPTTGYGILCGANSLHHDNYMKVFERLICPNKDSDIFYDVETLDVLVSSMGMTSTEMSAFYAAKYVLNKVRVDGNYKDGEYEKVQDSVEDNTRLAPLIEAYMEDETMTLDDLKDNVVNAFYDPII